MTATKDVSPCSPQGIIEYVILVDEQDQDIGMAEKLQAHEKNLLHRAFSVFVYRKKPEKVEILLQQRAMHKYHSPGLWTNTCCSHPRPGEAVIAAAKRRLQQEMGIAIELAELKDLGWFKYNAHFSNGLSEHEIDHVLIGKMPTKVEIQMNPDEVHDYRWITIEDLKIEMRLEPKRFTPWLAEALEVAERGYY